MKPKKEKNSGWIGYGNLQFSPSNDGIILSGVSG